MAPDHTAPAVGPRLTPVNQKVVHATEVSLLALQFLVPATGILLVVGTTTWPLCTSPRTSPSSSCSPSTSAS